MKVFGNKKGVLKKSGDFVELPTVKDYSVYVRKTAIVRVWDDNGVTAIMYSSNAIDHIKLSIAETFKRIES